MKKMWRSSLPRLPFAVRRFLFRFWGTEQVPSLCTLTHTQWQSGDHAWTWTWTWHGWTSAEPEREKSFLCFGHASVEYLWGFCRAAFHQHLDMQDSRPRHRHRQRQRQRRGRDSDSDTSRARRPVASCKLDLISCRSSLRIRFPAKRRGERRAQLVADTGRGLSCILTYS